MIGSRAPAIGCNRFSNNDATETVEDGGGSAWVFRAGGVVGAFLVTMPGTRVSEKISALIGLRLTKTASIDLPKYVVRKLRGRVIVPR
jgi:hypothetical protein